MTKLKRWDKTEIKELRKLAGVKPTERIAKKLRRSVGATRQKAYELGISMNYHYHA